MSADKNIFRHLFTAFLFSLVFALSADTRHGFLSEESILQAAAKINAENFPDADDVLIDDYVLTTYEKDGRAQTWDDWASKILSEKGKQDNQLLTLYFNASYGSAEFVFVRIFKADGRRQELDLSRHCQEMIDRSQMGSNIYDPNNKLLQVSVPDLEPGDTMRVLTRRVISKPRVPDSYSDFQVLEHSSPILRYVYEVNAPEELPLRNIVIKDELPGTLTSFPARRSEGRIVYRWEAKDVPQFFREPAMPPSYTVTQRLLLSTIESWEDISRWYWQISLPHFEANSDIERKVQELVEGKPGSQERLRAIFRFVSQEIRYMGVTLETEAPGYEPHDVSITFANRHGVCRDKAALLCVMLRLAGFEAFPVLIHAGAKKDPEVPQPFFNHAIVAVLNEDQSYQLMDPTDENTKELLPAYLCNRSYLVARPEGERLRTSEIQPYTQNLCRIKTRGKVSEQGDLSASCQIIMEGINDNAYRGMLLRRSPQQRQEFFEAVLKGLFPGAKLLRFDILPPDLQDTELPLEFHLAFEAKELLHKNQRCAMLKTPRLGAGFGYVNFVLGDAGLEQRRFPFMTNLSCGVIEESRIEMPEKWNHALSLPVYDDIDEANLHWSRQLQFQAGTLRQDSEFSIRGVEFSPSEYLRLKQALRSIEANALKQAIFTEQESGAGTQAKSREASNLEEGAECLILSEQFNYRLEDAHNWTLQEKRQKKILSYKGMKDNSELQFDYNPAWEEVKLDYALVRNGEQELRISEAEINLMDAPWVGAAPRYPGGKTLVASLPGVQIGSVIEYQVTRSYRGLPYFYVMLSFQSQDAIVRRELSIDCPSDLRLHSKLYPNGYLNFKRRSKAAQVKYERSNDKQRHIQRWSVVNQAALSRERALPPAHSYLPTVVAWSGSWKDYTEQLARSFDFASQGGKALNELLQALKKMPDDTRLLSLRNHIERGVRRAGPYFTQLPRYCLSPAETTYNEAYGNSADRAALYYALLKALDYEPELLLVSSSAELQSLQKFTQSHPAPNFFPELLVRVRSKQGDIWFNDQDQYGHLGGSSYEGMLAYSLTKKRFFRISLPQSELSLSNKLITIDLQPDGSAQIAYRIIYQGENYAGKNKFYSELTPEQRRRHYQSMLAELSQSATAVTDLKTEFQTYPGLLRFSAKVADFAVVSDGFYYFEFPEDLSRLLRPWGDERIEPLYWPRALRQQTELVIRLPSTYRTLELCPQDFSWRSPDKLGEISIKRQKTASKNELRFLLEADLGAEIISADKYGEILEVNRKLAQPASRTVLLRK